jgi:hypothetical protein
MSILFIVIVVRKIKRHSIGITPQIIIIIKILKLFYNLFRRCY